MKMTMGRRAYPSDLTDAQWALLEPLIPQPSLQGRRPFVSRREGVNAILYVLRSGCPWRMLPHEFPKWQTVYSNFRRWEREGAWDRILHTLRMRMRTRQGRDRCRRARRLLTVSPSKPVRCVDRKRAMIWGKKTWGRKRHALVDPQGNLLAIKVLGAEGSDQQGGRALLSPLKGAFPRLKLIWGDSHYGGTFLTWVKEQLGWTVRTIHALTFPKRGLLVPEGEEVDWEALFPSGFRPQPKRWIIERTFSWLVRWRRLCRDHEGLPQSSEAFIKLSASYRMLITLVPSFPS